MATFREQIVSFVDDNWMVPCRDGLVWVYYGAINTQAKIAAQKKATGRDFVPAFLRYPDAKYGSLEGLYLIPAADLAKVKGGQFDVAKFPDRKMLSSWFDKADKDGSNPEVLAQKPADNGLNDCTFRDAEPRRRRNPRRDHRGGDALQHASRLRGHQDPRQDGQGRRGGEYH